MATGRHSHRAVGIEEHKQSPRSPHANRCTSHLRLWTACAHVLQLHRAGCNAKAGERGLWRPRGVAVERQRLLASHSAHTVQAYRQNLLLDSDPCPPLGSAKDAGDGQQRAGVGGEKKYEVKK